MVENGDGADGSIVANGGETVKTGVEREPLSTVPVGSISRIRSSERASNVKVETIGVDRVDGASANRSSDGGHCGPRGTVPLGKINQISVTIKLRELSSNDEVVREARSGISEGKVGEMKIHDKVAVGEVRFQSAPNIRRQVINSKSRGRDGSRSAVVGGIRDLGEVASNEQLVVPDDEILDRTTANTASKRLPGFGSGIETSQAVEGRNTSRDAGMSTDDGSGARVENDGVDGLRFRSEDELVGETTGVDPRSKVVVKVSDATGSSERR